MDEDEDKRMLADPAVEGNRPRSVRSRKRVPDAAFEKWLQHGLHAMYDDVANEPIPEELLRLIAEKRTEDPKQ
jgi:hypothetical protein